MAAGWRSSVGVIKLTNITLTYISKYDEFTLQELKKKGRRRRKEKEKQKIKKKISKKKLCFHKCTNFFYLLNIYKTLYRKKERKTIIIFNLEKWK